MTHLHVRATFFLTAFLVLSTLAAPAAAQDASALVEQGLTLRERGDDAGALRRFEAAYALEPAARTRAQIALAEMALSRWLDAERHLTEALATQDPWIENNRVALNGAMAGIREHIGRLQVEADQPDAELWIDGQRVGSLPLPNPIARDPGPVTFEVRADGFETEARTVTLGGGQVTREVVRLRATGEESEPEPEAIEETTSSEQVFDAHSGGGGVSIPGVVLLAGGGAAAVAGAVLLGVAFSSKASLESPGEMRAWTAGDQAAADQVPVLAGAGEVLLGVGVAAAVVGVILIVVDGGGDDSQARLRDDRLEVRF